MLICNKVSWLIFPIDKKFLESSVIFEKVKRGSETKSLRLLPECKGLNPDSKLESSGKLKKKTWVFPLNQLKSESQRLGLRYAPLQLLHEV